MSSGAKVQTNFFEEAIPGTTASTGKWKTPRLTSNTVMRVYRRLESLIKDRSLSPRALSRLIAAKQKFQTLVAVRRRDGTLEDLDRMLADRLGHW